MMEYRYSSGMEENMIKILLGGSPCTNWSIAQKNNRETEPNGIGYELFKNFVTAKEKYEPNYFLYENNKSIAPAIKERISKDLGVELQYINSSLVSAQNRQRFYCHNIPNVPQPEDKGILLKDIIESGAEWQEKAYCLTSTYNGAVVRNALEKKQRTMIAQPVRLGHFNKGGQGDRIYSVFGKSICLSANGGGRGAKTGLCAVPVDKSFSGWPVYEVANGIITIKDKQHKIKLPDGYYVIRKLTILECKRLQTVPDNYIMPCSATQNYKMLGNGWTVDVIAHILSHIPSLQNEDIEVLSMYDGMSCGQIALQKLSVNVVKYYATEIDKYAIQTTMANFPNTVQLGDAFQVRNEAGSFKQKGAFAPFVCTYF